METTSEEEKVSQYWLKRNDEWIETNSYGKPLIDKNLRPNNFGRPIKKTKDRLESFSTRNIKSEEYRIEELKRVYQEMSDLYEQVNDFTQPIYSQLARYRDYVARIKRKKV